MAGQGGKRGCPDGMDGMAGEPAGPQAHISGSRERGDEEEHICNWGWEEEEERRRGRQAGK